MFDWAKTVEAIGNAVKSISESLSIVKNRQSETEIIKENKKLKKAINSAEDMLILIYKYVPLFDEDDIEEFKKLVERFKKYN